MTNISNSLISNEYLYNKINNLNETANNRKLGNYSLKKGNLSKDTFDYSADDGKISFKDKTKNFIKGVISPITMMFSSPKNFAMGAVAILGGGILLAATSGAIAPVLVAGGIAGGAVQFGISAYKASTAKTDEEARNAWQGMGAGTSSVAMSAAGAKSALKASGANIEGMSVPKAVFECIKQTPKNIKNSFNTFKSGQAFVNIKNIFKPKVTTDKKNIQKPEESQKQITSSSDKSRESVSGVEYTADRQGITDIPDEKINIPKKDVIYEDDGVFGYDYTGSDIREEMRERILSRATLTDEHLTVQTIDDSRMPQLKTGSKYYELGEPKLNNKTNQYIHIFENLKDMPDGDGLRGKTPLSGKKGLKFKLQKLKNSGIKRVIDLRAKGECSAAARTALTETGLDYVNFPVEDGNWNIESLRSITEYIKAIKSGDYYVGCANGQARTDLAVAINYILNPEAKTVPQLYYGTVSSSRVSVKNNLLQILELVKNNPDIVKDWGWSSFEEFSNCTTAKLQALLSRLINN